MKKGKQILTALSILGSLYLFALYNEERLRRKIRDKKNNR